MNRPVTVLDLWVVAFVVLCITGYITSDMVSSWLQWGLLLGVPIGAIWLCFRFPLTALFAGLTVIGPAVAFWYHMPYADLREPLVDVLFWEVFVVGVTLLFVLQERLARRKAERRLRADNTGTENTHPLGLFPPAKKRL